MSWEDQQLCKCADHLFTQAVGRSERRRPPGDERGARAGGGGDLRPAALARQGAVRAVRPGGGPSPQEAVLPGEAK